MPGLTDAAASRGGNNDPVADIAGNQRRLDPRVMVAATRTERPSLLWFARGVLGVAIAIMILILLSNTLKLWSLLPAIVVGAAAIYKSNGQGLLQISAEISSHRGHDPVPSSALPKEPELVLAIDIRPGDWILSQFAYERKLQETEAKDRRRREADEERQRVSGGTERIASRSAQNPKPLPAKVLAQVIVAERTADKTMHLGFSDGKDSVVFDDDAFYRRRPRRILSFPPTVQEASEALTDLLTLVDSGSMYENDLIESLSTGHSGDSVRRALRAALRGRLVTHKLGIGRCLREASAIFSPRMSAALRHKRIITLSEAGEMWVRSGSTSPAEKKLGESDPLGQQAHTRDANVHSYFINKPSFHAPVTIRGPVTRGDSRSRDKASYPERSHVAQTRPASPAPSGGAESLGAIVVWSAGVSAAGASLAALLAEAHTPWLRALFISLTFLAACAFVILVGAGLASLLSWRRARERGPGKSVPVTQVQRGPAAGPATATYSSSSPCSAGDSSWSTTPPREDGVTTEAARGTEADRTSIDLGASTVDPATSSPDGSTDTDSPAS